jgi:hypothetical protein
MAMLGVGEHQDVSPAGARPCIAGPRDTDSRRGDEMHHRPPHNGGHRTVRRAIVHHDDFAVRRQRAFQVLDRAQQLHPFVERDHDNADRRGWHETPCVNQRKAEQ